MGGTVRLVNEQPPVPPPKYAILVVSCDNFSTTPWAAEATSQQQSVAPCKG